MSQSVGRSVGRSVGWLVNFSVNIVLYHLVVVVWLYCGIKIVDFLFPFFTLTFTYFSDSSCLSVSKPYEYMVITYLGCKFYAISVFAVMFVGSC